MGRIIGHLCSAQFLTSSLRLIVHCLRHSQRQIIQNENKSQNELKRTGQIKKTLNEPFRIFLKKERKMNRKKELSRATLWRLVLFFKSRWNLEGW
jgi:type III secretory pathway component EscR